MANHPGPEALGLIADGIDHLFFLLFFFLIDKFYLDQFVFFQSRIDGGNDFGRQTVFSDKNQWFESMGKASEVFVLLAGKLLWHGSMLSRLWFDADRVPMAGLVDAFNYLLSILSCSASAGKGRYLRYTVLTRTSVMGHHQTHGKLTVTRCAADPQDLAVDFLITGVCPGDFNPFT